MDTPMTLQQAEAAGYSNVRALQQQINRGRLEAKKGIVDHRSAWLVTESALLKAGYKRQCPHRQGVCALCVVEQARP